VRATSAVVVSVSSGYRSPELNQAVGGSVGSAHRYGFADGVSGMKADCNGSKDRSANVASASVGRVGRVDFRPIRAGHRAFTRNHGCRQPIACSKTMGN
jgi:hypothetical protein